MFLLWSPWLWILVIYSLTVNYSNLRYYSLDRLLVRMTVTQYSDTTLSLYRLHYFAREKNLIPKKSIDVCFQKMLSCLSNISFNEINMFSCPFTHHPAKSKQSWICIHAEHHLCGTMIHVCPQWNSDLVSEKSVNFVFVFLEDDRN